jgi:phosphoribosylformimino-5-aminoimidazole carboxamide ribonucleotide (ProFAR) isomerase
MASAVGVQALVAALPLLHGADGEVQHLQHLKGTHGALATPIRELIAGENVSEVLVIDVASEGEGHGFNPALLQAVEAETALPLLAFGGLASTEQIRPLLSRSQLAGVVVGNALNYREHAIGQLKAALTDQPLRLHRQRRSL